MAAGETARPGGAPAASVSAGSSLRAFRETGAFEASFLGFLHSRLRRTVDFMVGAVALLVAATVASYVASGDSAREPFLRGARPVLLGCLVAVAALRLPLRPARPAARVLGAVDTAVGVLTIVGATAYYAWGYEKGPVLLVPILCLLLVARAVFVPSRPLRTFLLALPAPFAVLAVELAHGTLYSLDGDPVTRGSYVAHVLWEQALLAISIGLATYASHVNFALRVEAHRAAELGQYELIEKLGEGAMGEVWRARHALLRRETAIKTIRAELVDESTMRRFEEEVRQTCRLTHPNVIAIYDYGRTPDGVFFYAMEILDGLDLDRIVGETGPLPPARVIHVLVQACAALHEAHSRGLVHRDVKAANLVLCERGLERDVVKVMDFGLVKDVSDASASAASGEICGTPETMAPETIRGRPAAPSVDVYALGAVGCYLLTGRQIFDVERAADFFTSHLARDPVPPTARDPAVPRDLEETLLRCLRKEPESRTPSAAALRRELLACADAGRWTQEAAAAWWEARAVRARSA